MAGKAALNGADVLCAQRHDGVLTRGGVQRAAKLQTCGGRERGRERKNALLGHLADGLDAFKLDGAGREQVVLRKDDFLRAAQQVRLTRTGDGSARGQQTAGDVLVACAEGTEQTDRRRDRCDGRERPEEANRFAASERGHEREDDAEGESERRVDHREAIDRIRTLKLGEKIVLVKQRALCGAAGVVHLVIVAVNRNRTVGLRHRLVGTGACGVACAVLTHHGVEQQDGRRDIRSRDAVLLGEYDKGNAVQDGRDDGDRHERFAARTAVQQLGEAHAENIHADEHREQLKQEKRADAEGGVRDDVDDVRQRKLRKVRRERQIGGSRRQNEH